MHLYTTIIKRTLTYGWTLISRIEQKLMLFENKILRTICGPVYNNELGCWHRRRHKEIWGLTQVPKITNFMKSQRIKWKRYVMRLDSKSNSGWEEIHMKETKNTSKETIDSWNKAGLKETRNTKLRRKSTKIRRVEGVDSGNNSWKVVISERKRTLF